MTVGRLDIEVIHTPGHSEGSVSFDIAGAALITGDTLFHKSVGRVELGVEAGIEESDVIFAPNWGWITVGNILLGVKNVGRRDRRAR